MKRPDPKSPAWPAYWSEQKREAQELTDYEIGGRLFPRVAYGDDYPDAAGTCRDCGVEHGELHVVSCAIERCPICRRGQALGCTCYEAAEVTTQ